MDNNRSSSTENASPTTTTTTPTLSEIRNPDEERLVNANSNNNGQHHEQQPSTPPPNGGNVAKDPQLRGTSFNLHHHHRQSSGELRSPPGPASQMNGASPRRPQTLLSPSDQLMFPPKTLKLTIHKDENGYGMKVSGDKPVFVESVKPNGAAHKAGLIASDMILEVNGNPVRYSTHTDVVKWIKASEIVELTVQRGQKMQRPTSITSGVSPSTPLAQRGSITAPLPVDQDKRREMEFSKIHTLRLMLAQEKKSCDALNATNVNNSNKEDLLKSEAKIKKLQEQLKQVCGEDMMSQSAHFAPMPTRSSAHINAMSPPPTTTVTPTTHHSTPAFLSLFPRSLSSLSLGTRKKDKDNEPNLSHNNSKSSAFSSPTATGGGGGGGSGSGGKKNKHSQQMHSADIPPPLPQRNPPRKSMDINSNPFEIFRNTPISDLDHSGSGIISPNNNVHCSPIAETPNKSRTGGQQGSNSSGKSSANSTPPPASNNNNNDNGSAGKKKRSKNKTKALSDPKMSSQMFIQMEQQGGHQELTGKPPPLPPRQYLLDENRINNNLSHSNSRLGGGQGSPSGGNSVHDNGNNGRALPNSIDTVFNYPLVSQCTPVRDNLSPFPFTHRPNIVQKLQEHQQGYPFGGAGAGGGGGKRGLQQKSHHDNPVLSSTSSHISANKSTAFGLTPQQMQQIGNNSGGKQHRRNISSPEQVVQSIREEAEKHDSANMTRVMSRSAWEDRRSMDKESDRTPPGTPPPPYRGDSVHHLGGGDSVTDHSAVGSPKSGGGVSGASAQKQIISMEDEEGSDQEMLIDEHGPFKSLSQLLEQENTVYLTVFLNYVLSNSNPTPLLFYLITRIYRDGTAKDMRKWAYEIHSTFLVPGAPLLLPNIEESLAHEVDSVLIKEFDKGEILRKIFWKSRNKSKEMINVQLQEFQTTRIAGLATMFGPSDQQLQEAKGDKAKEQKIVEETLIPKLVQLVDELEKEPATECPKKQALCSALSTVLHRIFVTRSNQANSPIDKVHHFVSREKSFKSRLMGKNRKEQVLGHSLVLRQYYEVTHCNHCQNIIWGVSPQGYRCTNCELNIHRICVRILEENCPGPAPQKRKEQHSDNKISKFMEKIRPTHHFIQAERRRLEEEGSLDDAFGLDRPVSGVTRQPSDRRPAGNASVSLSSQGSVSATDNGNSSMHHQGSFSSPKNGSNATGGGGAGAGGLPSTVTDALAAQGIDINASFKEAEKQQSSKSAPVSVNRSESYKETLTHARSRNRRKTSDPSLSKTSDDQNLVLGLKNATFPTSSHSSFSSSSLDNTPSSSLEAVAATTTANVAVIAPREWAESDDECLGDEDWASQIASELLQSLTDAEKKRQEIINEIYITERNHVRTLRLLGGVFMAPLQKAGLLADHLQLLFPQALVSLQDLHGTFEAQLKQRRIESAFVVGEIGDLLLTMFDGRSGEELKDYAAQFCARQRIALEALKDRRRKDENLQRLLTKQEAHKACRRLQLKDLLPTALQRLTKYPLLFENLLKVTNRVMPESTEEADAIRRALKSSRDILNHVNQAVRVAEDTHKLQSIQRKLDRSMFDRETGNSEFKNIDLTAHKLVHSGLLILKKNPAVQFQGLLFEDVMVLLQKQDDKYIIKSYNNPGAAPGENKSLFFPVIKMTGIIVRPSAVDRQTFFVINTGQSQMLELTAPSANECKAWLKHIPETSEALRYRNRTGGPPPLVQDGDDMHTTSGSGPGVQSKDSFESVGSAGTPDADVILHSDLSNVKLKGVDAESSKRANRKGSSVSSGSSAVGGRHRSSDRQNHYQNADQQNRNVHKGSPAAAAATPKGAHSKRKGAPHALPSSKVTDEEGEEEEEDVVMSPEHEYEDIPDQSDDETKEDRWNEDSRRTTEGKDELDDEQKRSRRRRTADNDGDDEGEEDDDEDGSLNVGTTNSNDTRTLTQQCSLVAPNEVHITESPSLIAQPVLSESEKLRRIDDLITSKLAEKQQIICNMFRVPMEDFNTIVDIASQPEAPQEPSDLTLAAFSQIQSLIATLNEHIRITPHAEICAVAAAVKEPIDLSSVNLCDDCHSHGQSKATTDVMTPGGGGMKAQPQHMPKQQQQIVLHEDEDGYCELVEVTGRDRRRRSSSINNADFIAESSSSTAVNGDSVKASTTLTTTTTTTDGSDAAMLEETLLLRPVQKETVDEDRLAAGGDSYFKSAMKLKQQLLTSTQTVPLSLIAANVLALNQTITKLLCKQPERDQERSQLRRELQNAQNHFSSLHLASSSQDVPDGVSEIEESCVKKVAYVCGEEAAADAVVRLGRGGGDVVDGIIPNLDLSVVEEDSTEGEKQESSSVADNMNETGDVELSAAAPKEKKEEEEEVLEQKDGDSATTTSS